MFFSSSSSKNRGRLISILQISISILPVSFWVHVFRVLSELIYICSFFYIWSYYDSHAHGMTTSFHEEGQGVSGPSEGQGVWAFRGAGGLGLQNEFNPTTFYCSACTKTRKVRVSCIDFASLYEFSIRFRNCCDSVLFLFFILFSQTLLYLELW